MPAPTIPMMQGNANKGTTDMTRKIARNDTVTFNEDGGFSVDVKLTGYCAVDHFKACNSIKDIERCASMGDFKILGYDLVSAVS